MIRVLLLVLAFFFHFQLLSQSFYTLEDNCFSLTEDGLEYYERILPNSFDLSGSDYWPPVYQQTHWVCNQVAASYYMLSYETNLKKDISSQNPQNIFSVYFPWNIGNGGHGWFGDNYIISMELMKKLGIPKLLDNPADIYRDSSLWLDGYQNYYEAMHNRILDYYVIKTNSNEGITTLKSWVFDHFEGGDYGGTATFMANIAEGGDDFLPNGSSHAGAYVITRCGDNALHARTIVGYDDNICYDYNNDGQYTTDIDLNGDGIIDIRDSEKGGFKLAESYGPTWQGDGYCWIMYKAMSDAYKEGGILNSNVHVIKPLINYSPHLTARIKITYPSRINIKLKIGVTGDTLSNEYEYIQDFPILNFQGGDLYMQGGSAESDKTIEMGLDLTNFEEYFNSDNCARFFIQIIEYDPQNLNEGILDEFAIIDYSGSEPKEFLFPVSTELVNNSVTEIALNVCMNCVDAPKILTNALPIFTQNSSVWFPLSFDGGTPPYTWEFVPYFEVTEFNRTYDAFEGTKLTPDTYFDGELTLDIPFAFPFNNTATQKIKVHTNGYVFPFSTTFNWNQFREYLYPFFINENVIAPLARYSLVSDPSKSDGIWYKFVQDTVKIRWKECEQYAESWTSVHFGCNLISDGSVEFTYGQNYLSKRYTNLGGISYGNKVNHVLAYLDNVPAINTGLKIQSYPKPQGLLITESGIIYGEIGNYNHYPVKIKLTDANGISCSRVYDLSTNIEEFSSKKIRKIELYPNPASDKIIFQVNDICYEKANIRIYDNLGRLVESYNNIALDNFILNINDYKFGRYHINFISGTNVYTSGFIKK
jgi:hypothetical protein